MNSSGRMVVSDITHKDILCLMVIERESYDESAHSGVNFDEDIVFSRIVDYIDNKDSHMAIKCSLGDEIVGYFYACKTNLDFSSTPIGWESSFYVRKQSRGSRAIILLFNTFFNWCKENDIKHTLCMVSHSLDNNAAYKLCEKMGMRERGKVFERIL